MRGFTMILVVFSHVCTLTFVTESVTNNIFILFRMPLFFFISGLMSYTIYTRQLIKRRLRNRILCQLIPTIIVGLLFCFTFSKSIGTAVTDNFKAGYWFTIVMVEFFLLYMLYVIIINRFKINITTQTTFLIILIFITNIFKTILFKYGIFTNTIAEVFSLSIFFSYLPYFLFGILSKMNQSLFIRFLNNKYSIPIAIVGFIGLLFYDILGRSAFIQGFLGIVIIYRFFEYYKSFFSSKTTLGSYLCYIGKHTLEIYLIHYFFIYSLINFAQHINLTTIQSSWLVEIIIFLIISIIVIVFCLFTTTFIKISPILYSLLFGFKK